MKMKSPMITIVYIQYIYTVYVNIYIYPTCILYIYIYPYGSKYLLSIWGMIFRGLAVHSQTLLDPKGITQYIFIYGG